MGQLADTIRWIGDEKRAILHVRRHMALSFKGIPGVKERRVRLLRAESSDEIRQCLEDIIELARQQRTTE